MTNFLNQNAQRTILSLLFVAMSTSTLSAQFPVQETNQMVGSWKVTNVDDFSIQLQINRQNQFRMMVNGQTSQGQLEASGNVVTLNFTDGTKQKFNKSFENGNMIFAATDGSQSFVMGRVEAENTRPAQVTGFPNRPSTDEIMEQDVEEDVSAATPDQKIIGKWYAKLEDDQVDVFVKSEFKADGTYTTSLLLVAGSEKETQKDQGRWSVKNGKLISVSEGETDQEIVPIEFSNENLIVDMTAEFGTRMVMSRSPEQVKPSKFDIQKLIEYAQQQAGGGW